MTEVKWRLMLLEDNCICCFTVGVLSLWESKWFLMCLDKCFPNWCFQQNDYHTEVCTTCSCTYQKHLKWLFLPSLTFVLINMAINVKQTFVCEKYAWLIMFLFVGCFEDHTCSLISEFNFVSMCYDLLMLYILDYDFQFITLKTAVYSRVLWTAYSQYY